MAKLHGPFSFSGPLGGIIAYRRKDLEGTFLRTPSLLTKERIYSDPAFANTLRHATEGGGRSGAAWWLRRVLHPLEPVRDHNWQGALTGALTPLQRMDTESPYGQRRLLLSRHGHLLAGLCLSRRTPFEQLLRSPVDHTLSKDSLRAQLKVPELNAGGNFLAPPSLPYFCLVGVLGVVPDLFYTPGGYGTDADYSGVFPQAAFSDWYPVRGGAPALSLELQLTQQPPNGSFGLLLAVGVVMGSVNKWGRIEAVKYAGSGRIVAVG